MEEVAIYIWFEFVTGTGGGLGLRPRFEPLLLPAKDGAGNDCCADTRRVFAFDFGLGSGGGKGDIETAETDAE